MKYLLFEWMVGGGLIESGDPLDPNNSFLKQGSAMFAAMAEDLIAAGHHVVAPLDARVCQLELATPWAQKRLHFDPAPLPLQADLWQSLCALADNVDQIFIVAPECEGILAQCYRHLSDHHAKWFGGPLDWIELASDKNQMQAYLKAHGVAVPPTATRSGGKWVAKPTRGAGSDGVRVFFDTKPKTAFQDSEKWRIEKYIPGKSVSVTVIKVGGRQFYLPPTGQIFAEAKMGIDTISSGSIGNYVDAKFPLERRQAQRALALARQTVEVLPEFKGYIGIDMILADEGSDVVIEINPRMTMSYCHLPKVPRGSWLKAVPG